MASFIDDLKNAFNKPNNSLYQLIAINIIIYLITVVIYVIARLFTADFIWMAVYNNLAIPSIPIDFLYKPWTLITYMFVHDFMLGHNINGIFHILFNMLALYWFGQLIMEYLGSKKILSLYILGGIAGALLYLLILNTMPLFSGRSAAMIGASASVYAIVVGAATLLPDYTFFLLFIGPVRIKYIAAIYVLISFLGSVGSNAGGEIAHLGGALLGFIFITQLKKGTDLGKPVIAVLEGIGGLFKKRSKVKITYKGNNSRNSSKSSSSNSSKSSTNTVDQDEIDAILDKISQSGYEKLTTEEKQKLFKASQKK